MLIVDNASISCVIIKHTTVSYRLSLEVSLSIFLSLPNQENRHFSVKSIERRAGEEEKTWEGKRCEEEPRKKKETKKRKKKLLKCSVFSSFPVTLLLETNEFKRNVGNRKKKERQNFKRTRGKTSREEREEASSCVEGVSNQHSWLAGWQLGKPTHLPLRSPFENERKKAAFQAREETVNITSSHQEEDSQRRFFMVDVKKSRRL